MKHVIIFISILFATIATVKPQSVTLTFTGHNQNNVYTQLNRVVVTNLTKDWYIILHWPDTILTMNQTGIDDHAEATENNQSSLRFAQNNPNPFDGTTHTNLTMVKDGDVTVEITDVVGRIVETKVFSSLQAGTHQLHITLSTAGMYFLTARQNGQSTSIKMVNRGNGGTDDIKITNNIETLFMAASSPKNMDGLKGSTNNPFEIGDQMEYIGYAIEDGIDIESSHVTQALTASETIQLQFTTSQGDALPCPGTPTVTDYDGNVYNTVQIGNQCWMKENLRTTHYANGDSILLNTQYYSFDPYRYAPGKDEINVPIYGYLYNWAAVMHGEASSSSNPSGIQGICPTGWHIPSDAEWTQLTDYVSSRSQYQCNNNPNYIAKALASNTSWTVLGNTCAVGSNLNTNNATGFSALAAGNFYNYIEQRAFFWSCTETSSVNALSRLLAHNHQYIESANYAMDYPFSVRCILN